MKKVLACLVILICFIWVVPSVLAESTVPSNLVVSIWPEYSDNQVFIIEQEALPTNTPLPAEVRFALPKGAKLTWAGEIIGASDTSKDLEAAATVNSLPDYEEVVFNLTKIRTAQIEANWAGLVATGNKRSVTMDWVQRYPVTRTLFEFQEPSQATNIKVSPPVAFVRQSNEGFKIHQTGPHSLAVGEALRVQITYDRSVTTPSVGSTGTPTQPAAKTTGAATSPIGTPILMVILAIGLAGIGYLVYLDNRKR